MITSPYSKIIIIMEYSYYKFYFIIHLIYSNQSHSYSFIFLFLLLLTLATRSGIKLFHQIIQIFKCKFQVFIIFVLNISHPQQMWFLNYCSPFLFNAGAVTTSYRYVMYSQVFAMFIIYLFQILAYKFASEEQDEMPKIQNQDPNTLLKGNKLKCALQNFWVSSKVFKQWYLTHFCLHAVSVGTCIFYSPYLPQMIFALIHFALWIPICVLYHCRAKKNKAATIIYNILMVLVGILNIMLLFSGSMGVGASGYDQTAKICLLQSGLLSKNTQSPTL